MHTNMLKPAKLKLVNETGEEVELNGSIEFEELDTNSISEIDPYKSISTTQLSMNINIDNSMKLTKKKFISIVLCNYIFG